MKTLAYHNLLQQPGESIPVAQFQVTLADFRHQMQRLRGRLLHPQEVEETIVKQHTFPDGILITFDDGGAGIIEAGRVLAEMELTGVAFICPGAVEEGLWFYRLANALAQTKHTSLTYAGQTWSFVNGSGRNQAYLSLSGQFFKLAPRIREERLEEIEKILSIGDQLPHPQLRILDTAGLKAAAETGGLLFANHSWSHPDLTVLGDETLHAELTCAAEWLRASGLPYVNWFAYPRGKHDARVRQFVRRQHKLAFGFQDARPRIEAVDLLPRIAINSLDRNPLRFRLKLWGAGRLARHWRR